MDTLGPTSSAVNRYHRQTLLPGIGTKGQELLANACVLLVGCGALGGVIADQLVRAGLGYLRLADRDLVELTNLQRQVLFDEEDARQGLPKAVAAANRLRQVNSEVTIEPLVVDVHAGNVETLVSGVALMIDGTDNAETRYLLNDVSVKRGVPWIYGACTGTEGRVMTILPSQTPCLRCLFPTPPSVGELPTCDTAGVLGPGASVIASLQSVSAIKLLTSNVSTVGNELLVFDFWNNRYRSVNLAEARRADCSCCSARHFDFLNAPNSGFTTQLCGRDAIQLRGSGAPLDLEILSRRLAAVGRVERTAYLLRCSPTDIPNIQFTLFPDGRTIVRGTTDPSHARSLFSRIIGH